MQEPHELLLNAIHSNAKALERLGNKMDTYQKELDTCKRDVIKLRYYMYAMVTIVLLTIGKPEILTAFLGGM